MKAKTLSVKVVEPSAPAKGTLFFLSGFPDRHNAFMDTLVPGLSQEYRCIVACMPDYDQDSLAKFLGYGRKEIVSMIDRTIATFAPAEPIVMVLHDWGSVYGMSWYAENR